MSQRSDDNFLKKNTQLLHSGGCILDDFTREEDNLLIMHSFLKHPGTLLFWYIFLKVPSDPDYIQYSNSAWVLIIHWPNLLLC